MELGAVILVLVVAVAVGLFIAQPLQSSARRATRFESQEVSALLAERERAINALQELDFDHVLGKVPAEDYPAQRAALVQRGGEILMKLDALALTPNPSPDYGRGGRNHLPSPVLGGGAGGEGREDDLEALIVARRSARKNKSGGFCPRCGKPVMVTDRFCPNCGKAI